MARASRHYIPDIPGNVWHITHRCIGAEMGSGDAGKRGCVEA
ncbi:MAG: hypothetical protein QME78_09315 [Thermodesulfobacteriota bacterium]|nr:hypothetical protein [Thermodesulfobacteriota bacterium]